MSSPAPKEFLTSLKKTVKYTNETVKLFEKHVSKIDIIGVLEYAVGYVEQSIDPAKLTLNPSGQAEVLRKIFPVLISGFDGLLERVITDLNPSFIVLKPFIISALNDQALNIIQCIESGKLDGFNIIEVLRKIIDHAKETDFSSYFSQD